MSTKLKDRLFEKACRIAACDASDDSLGAIMETVGKEMGLSGVMYLHTGEIPMLFDIQGLWEPEENIGEKRPILDCSEHPESVPVDPFREGRKYAYFEDVDKAAEPSEAIEFLSRLGIRAAMATALSREYDHLGFMLYYDTRGPRAWTTEEREAAEKLADVIYAVLIRKRKAETLSAVAAEANRRSQRAEAQRGRFLTNISREMRTPINAITGMISIMRHNMENPEVMAQCLGRMDKSSKALMDLISDCVDMTLIDHDEMKLNNEWIAPSDLFAGALELTTPVAEARAQKLSLTCDETVKFYGDRIKLTRILLTLITNACRHAGDEGNITGILRYIDMGKDKKAVEIRITDDGDGLDEDEERNVFNPFVEARAQTMNSGNGLSLMLMKQLVDMMHGSIDLFTRKGEGTKVVMVIPTRLRTAAVLKKNDDAPEESSEDAELYMGRRILVAEDNVLMAEIFATIMGYRGLDVDTAMNGQEAVDMYCAHDPFYYDMIFMDIQMPVMDGIEATNRIRKSGHPDAGVIPIIALSAQAFDEDRKRSIEAGMNAHLEKPVSDKDLFETIGRFLL